MASGVWLSVLQKAAWDISSPLRVPLRREFVPWLFITESLLLTPISSSQIPLATSTSCARNPGGFTFAAQSQILWGLAARTAAWHSGILMRWLSESLHRNRDQRSRCGLRRRSDD